MKSVISMPSTTSTDEPSRESPSEGRRGRLAPAATHHSALPALLLGGLALLGWMGLQTLQLARERSTLQTAHAAQQQTVDNAAQLRAKLDALAADTQRLADSGNQSARALVDELRKRGITINPAAAAPKPTPP